MMIKYHYSCFTILKIYVKYKITQNVYKCCPHVVWMSISEWLRVWVLLLYSNWAWFHRIFACNDVIALLLISFFFSQNTGCALHKVVYSWVFKCCCTALWWSIHCLICSFCFTFDQGTKNTRLAAVCIADFFLDSWMWIKASYRNFYLNGS